MKRGIIETADGVTVAESFPVGGGKNPVYVREYPQGALFGHPVGYNFIEVGRTGIERSENGFLAGERNEFASIIDQLRDVPQEGDDVTLTIDAQTQGIATQALQSAIAANAPTVRRRRRRGRDRAGHGSGTSDGVLARIRPERAQERRGVRSELNRRPGLAPRQPTDAERVSARLDDEGRDRRGGPRLRRDSARHGDQRRLAEGDRRRRPSERGRRELRGHQRD